MKKKYYLFKLNLTVLNILSIIIFVIMMLVSHFILGFSNIFDNWFNILFWYLLYTILHEILHSLSYVLNGAKFNKVTFGIMLEKGILYCLCKQNISKRNILISSICPLFIIGVFTYIVSIIFDNSLLMFLSCLNICGSIGDIITFIFLSKIKDFEFTEIDDPTMFAVYCNKDISKIKHFGLEYIGKSDSVKRLDFKKIDVSIFSIIILLFLFIMSFN